MVGDLLADVQARGFSPADITVPVLILHGAEDRMVPSERPLTCRADGNDQRGWQKSCW